MHTTRSLRSLTAGFAALSVVSVSAPAIAHPHQGYIHRHHRLATAVAGMAAFHYARHSHHAGRFVRHHHILTAVGAAMVAHHIAKHHM